uniref:C2H2-type domain-containing protein n=1 Tax=Hordeum vulgare subsp. vulgare TaxID=112509 RepID=A0A8I7B6E3_HORVV
MAGSTDDRLVQSRRRRREIEEGEVASGYYMGGCDTDTDDEDARYYLHPLPLHDHPQPKMVTVTRLGPVPVLHQVVGTTASRSGSTTRPSSPTSSLSSDGTISDATAGSHAAAATVLFPACPVCHRQFHNSKAVHGHMRVHAQAKPKPNEEKKVSAAVSTVDNSVSVSMAIDGPTQVKVETSDQVIPGSGSSSSASVESSRQHAADLSMAIVLAGEAPPAAASNKVDIAPVAPAPEPAALNLQPPTPTQQHVAVAPPHSFLQPLRIIQHQDPAAQRGYSCKECNQWFPTHQGLGGHVAGHKNRRIAAEAAPAIAAGVDPMAAGGPKPEKLHPCNVCGEVYSSGVKLGGHKRKHYNGKPIVPKKRPRVLPIGLAIPGPAPALEAPVVAVPAAQPPQLPAAQPQQSPVVPAGCLRLFGVTIMQ